MSDRPTLEKEISDVRRYVAQAERDARQLREWIATNERALASQPESLRTITQDGLIRARGDLGLREEEVRHLRENLAVQERQLALLNEIERKQREINNLEREQERIFLLLERHRAELQQFQNSYEQFARPASAALPCELVLPNNARLPLESARGQYTIGWADGAGRAPDIDLASLGGGSLGVSRNHAILRFRNSQWDIEDLNSTNGTFVNESQITARVPTLLTDKTTIRVGSIKLFFRYITQTVRL